jgi:toxin ParE1/3/4
LALADRETIFDTIAADNPRAAVAADQRISDRVNRLLRLPRSGRPGRINGTREMVITRTPYIVAYWINWRYSSRPPRASQRAALARHMLDR